MKSLIQNIFSFLDKHKWFILMAYLIFMVTVFTASMLINIFERKNESKYQYVKLIELTEDDTDPEKWAINWPRQYDSYKKTAIATRTRFGGHGGSEALPDQKIERDPWLKRMFLGYAFSIDYRDRRGHAYMLSDQIETKRQNKPQSGSCLHCHGSVMPLYRELGGGDSMKGFMETYKWSYKDLTKKLHDIGHGHPVSCVDCHNPKTMELRVTRPAFIRGIRELAESDAPTPHIPSITQWRESSKKEKYDPNKHATRNEIRSMVCGQCHVEYYCSDQMPLTLPWGKGLKMENLEAYWNETKFPNGKRFYDYKHKESGAELLKSQHPEYELWSQGIHAKSGVSCADCHMPYMREGASKVSDHWVRSPLLNINNACQTCHRLPEKEILERVSSIQDKNHQLLQQAGAALMDLLDAVKEAKDQGISENSLKPALEMQRKAQWRLDYVASENSMGFHAPQEAARILAESIDYARQGQVIAIKAKP